MILLETNWLKLKFKRTLVRFFSYYEAKEVLCLIIAIVISIATMLISHFAIFAQLAIVNQTWDFPALKGIVIVGTIIQINLGKTIFGQQTIFGKIKTVVILETIFSQTTAAIGTIKDVVQQTIIAGINTVFATQI